MTQKGKNKAVKLAAAAVFLALALFLPFLTARIPRVGNAVAPMQLPVMLCGYVSGGLLGLAAGAAAPLLGCLFFGTPPLLDAVPMAFELAVYGLVTGVFYRRVFRRNAAGIYGSLLCAMLLGRGAAAAVKIVLLSLGKIQAFNFELFWAEYVAAAVPAILLQLVLVPVVVAAFQKAKLLE